MTFHRRYVKLECLFSVQAEVQAKTTTSPMRVTDTDLPIVVEPAEEQSKRDLPIMAGGHSQNM